MHRAFTIGGLVCGIFVLFATVASAQTISDSEIAECAATEGDSERLDCFDALARDASLDGPQVTSSSGTGTGDWNVRTSINPIDDSKTVLLSLDAQEGTFPQSDRPTLIARCKSDSTEVFIVWYEFLGDDDSSPYRDTKDVIVRIGDQPAEEQVWGVSTDSDAVFAPDWAGNLLKEMLNHDRFLAQITPYNESPRTAIFKTTGLREVLPELAETCGWELPQ